MSGLGNKFRPPGRPETEMEEALWASLFVVFIIVALIVLAIIFGQDFVSWLDG